MNLSGGSGALTHLPVDGPSQPPGASGLEALPTQGPSHPGDPLWTRGSLVHSVPTDRTAQRPSSQNRVWRKVGLSASPAPSPQGLSEHISVWGEGSGWWDRAKPPLGSSPTYGKECFLAGILGETGPHGRR